MEVTTSTPAHPPVGNVLLRGFKTVFVERKLPYRVTHAWDRMMVALGRRRRVVRVGGYKFHTRRLVWSDDGVLRDVVEKREYVRPGYEIGPDDVVIDIGANIGAFSVTAAAAARNGRVYAYEPEPENFALLQGSLAANGFRNATAFPVAVSDRTATLTLHLDPDNTCSHSLSARPGGAGSVQVPVIPLRQVFDDHNIARCDLLKLDAEGAEYEMLYGLPDDYFRRIRRLVMEYHLADERDRTPGEKLVRHLEDRGFVVTHTSPVSAVGQLVFATRSENG